MNKHSRRLGQAGVHRSRMGNSLQACSEADLDELRQKYGEQARGATADSLVLTSHSGVWTPEELNIQLLTTN